MSNILNFIDVQKQVQEYNTIFEICDINLAEYFNSCKIIKSEEDDLLSYEVETLGLYITKHPMEGYLANDMKGCIDIHEISEWHEGDRILTVGTICGIEVRKTKAKTNMASFSLLSDKSSIDCLIFSAKYAALQDVIEEGALIVLDGFVRSEDGKLLITVNNINTDYLPYLAVIEKYEKEKSIKTYKDVSLIDGSESELKFVINSKLAYILEKAK